MAQKTMAEQIKQLELVTNLCRAVGTKSDDATIDPGRTMTTISLGNTIQITYDTEAGSAGIDKLAETIKSGLAANKAPVEAREMLPKIPPIPKAAVS